MFPMINVKVFSKCDSGKMETDKSDKNMHNISQSICNNEMYKCFIFVADYGSESLSFEAATDRKINRAISYNT